MSSNVANRRPLIPALPAGLLFLGVALPNVAGAAAIQVVNLDPAGVGFNDPTPAPAVPNNPGQTVGEQKMAVVQWAANRLGQLLYSPVTIVVEVSHDDTMFCNANTGALAAAGPSWLLRRQSLVADHPNLPTWYPAALGQRLLGTTSFQQDVTAGVNPDLGASDCLDGFQWYFGLDGDTPMGTEPFAQTILHELTHGLGFAALVGSDGQVSSLDPTAISPYFSYAYDTNSQKFWWQLTAQERAASATQGLLVWAGPRTTLAASTMLTLGIDGSDHPFIYAPAQFSEGSSLSHFDTALTPDSLMEPYASSTIDVFSDDIDLGLEFLQDIGWRDPGCGNAILDDNEECDLGAGNDANADAPDECTTGCTWYVQDDCPNDPQKLEAGLCGCGVADTNGDGDQVPDCFDDCPSTPGDGPDGCPPADLDAGAGDAASDAASDDAAASPVTLDLSGSTGASSVGSTVGSGAGPGGSAGTTEATQTQDAASSATITSATITSVTTVASSETQSSDPSGGGEDTTTITPNTSGAATSDPPSAAPESTHVTTGARTTDTEAVPSEEPPTEGTSSGLAAPTTPGTAPTSEDGPSTTATPQTNEHASTADVTGTPASTTHDSSEQPENSGATNSTNDETGSTSHTVSHGTTGDSSGAPSTLTPDAGTADAGITDEVTSEQDGCQCSTPGIKTNRSTSQLLLGLVGAGMVAARRRKRALAGGPQPASH